LEHRIKDWYDGYIEEGKMDFYLMADSHLKHEKMKTYCQRPSNFTELEKHKNCMNTLRDDTTLIHMGDVGIAKPEDWLWMVKMWPGRKILIRGNHDRAKSNSWWMDQGGFDFACDGLKFRNCWITREPSTSLADGCELNLHGHLHNIWDGFVAENQKEFICTCSSIPHLLGRDEHERECPINIKVKPTKLKKPWQRLFALEYTNYMPVEFQKFISHPDRYQSRGPKP
jgi:calcineurin-like phosphoesterase family protein